MATIINRSAAQQKRNTVPPLLVDILLILGVVALLTTAWLLSARTAQITVDGIPDRVRSHRGTVGALLADLGLTLTEMDRVTPPPDARLTSGATITVERARPLRILSDGRDFMASTWGATVHEALADAGVAVDKYDRALVNGVEVTLDARLPAAQSRMAPVTYDAGYEWEMLHVEPVQIRLRRAIPITVDDGGVPYVVRTTAPTIGEALRQAQITLYLGDRVEPSLGSAASAGLRVAIARSVPVAVEVDGMRRKTRTQAETVADALAHLNVVAAGLDTVTPPLDTPLYPDIEIKVTRIREDIEIEEAIEPFESLFQGDPNLPIDTQQVINPGAEGITRMRYRTRYENGELVARVLEDEWIAQTPDTRIVAYGQRIEPQTAVVEGQTITYWRKIRMLATSYNAESAGGTITRTGDALRDGIVAVDPNLIPLRSRVYVPGYGMGDALDTGGGIIARRIDLAYQDRPFVWTRRWTDVYLLWPPPAASQITWVVPNYPRED